jgi:hypothetical protein
MRQTGSRRTRPGAPCVAVVGARPGVLARSEIKDTGSTKAKVGPTQSFGGYAGQ